VEIRKIERNVMNAWIVKIRSYLRQFIELGVLLIGVSVFAEILFGPNVAFFGSQVTTNLVALLNSLGESGIAALIVVFAIIITYRKLLK
jgi:hypothetical protein|tara:strand:- start:212 stop:478 length:267 start_codon:yes stop_codon:yes gene_type:complete